MSDNVLVGNATGQGQDYNVASDDDGTSQHQYVKLEFGPDNTQTKVSAVDPLPITGTALSGTIAISSMPAQSLTGTVAVSSVINPLPAGTNTLGTVARVGPTPAGTNVIGTVALTGVLPAGANFLGTVAASGTVAISSLVAALPAGTNVVGTVAITGALPAGSAFLGTIANAGTVAVSSVASALPTGANFLGTIATAGTVAVSNIVSALPAGTNTLGTIAPTGTFATKELRSSTGTMAHVGASSSVVGLLNSNANRLGASVANDATGNLYIGYASNVSTTDYVARLTQYAYWEAPYNYTGTICGFWSTVVASDGGARIAEYS